MNAITRREGLPRFPDLSELFEAPFLTTRTSSLRVETAVRDDHYVVRVEVPGVDPDDELTVTVEHGTLTIEAERNESTQTPQHSEFRYGSFRRTIGLPADADEQDVTATYDKGVLEVSIGLAEQKAQSKKVPISRPSTE
ncbi:Hsp20/alpha crystallin family protein [Nocardiopsis sp. YSL2]|uniref:Hsp20/alpha crystallin family protein n=1 Tax=Nocardiopsis sp. YSL2 TaxID=2939492 RepID=UPI0026F40F8F|nr:Hsp20/alpha crystallin family protein [Nocardiopsis sp. YSL2]